MVPQWLCLCQSLAAYIVRLLHSGRSYFVCRSELRPGSSKALQRAEAEAAWLRLHTHHELPVHVFRLGGKALLLKNLMVAFSAVIGNRAWRDHL